MYFCVLKGEAFDFEIGGICKVSVYFGVKIWLLAYLRTKFGNINGFVFIPVNV